MAQRKNSVVLNSTAIAKLQKLVDSGEYCSIDDAASHIIVSVLGGTNQYSPVPPKKEEYSLVLGSTPQNSNQSTSSKVANWLDSDD